MDLINPKHPPVTLSALTGRDYEPHQIVEAYYRGADPVVVNEYIQYLSANYVYRDPREWTKDEVERELKRFYKEHGAVRKSDLIPYRTGLPSRSVVERYFGTVEKCFKKLRIPYREERRAWTREGAEEALRGFFKKRGKILITDLTNENGLPSKKIVEKFWGSWPQCQSELRFSKWDRESCLLAISEFHLRMGRYPMKDEMVSRYGLPPVKTLKKHFKNLTAAISECVERRVG